MEKFTGVRFDSELGEYEVIVCGEVEGWGNTAREAAAKLQECIAWRATVASKTQPRKSVYQRDNAPQAAQSAARVIVPAKCETGAQRVTERPACPHFRAIKRCYSIFAERGLSVEDEPMRETLAQLLQKPVPSRKVLSGADWMRAGNLAKWRVDA